MERGEKNEKNGEIPSAQGEQDFPRTRTEVLAAAADGRWDPFFEEYLHPCWREIWLVCRSHGITLADAEDLYQELMLRVIQHAAFGPQVRQALAEEKESPDFRANLPGRYLKYRELPLDTARFRTFLKKVIRNVVLESLRRAQKIPKPLDSEQFQAVEPWIEQSITRSLDRQWGVQCLAEAAWRLHHESAGARTRARRRLFEVLYLSTAQGRSPGWIAGEYDLDRTTVSGLLSQARARFLFHLQKVSGINDPAELGDLLSGAGRELKEALALVHADCMNQTS